MNNIGLKYKVAVRRWEYHKSIWFTYNEATVLDFSLGIYTIEVVYAKYLFGLIKKTKRMCVGKENIKFFNKD